MPRTRSLTWSELKIGVVTIIAIIIAAVLIFSLTGSKGFSWQRYTLKTRFDNVAGLAPGSPVRLAGVEVGTVTGIDFAGTQVEVTFDVKRTMQPRITDKSVAALGSVSLLGESAIDITAAAAGTPVPEYGYVTSGRTKGSLADVAEQASGGIEELSGLIKDVRAGKGTVGRLVTDDQLYTELRQFTSSATSVTDALRGGRGTIARLINDPETVDALNGSLRNLEAMTRRINAGEGSIGKLMTDNAFSDSLTGATANLRTLGERLNRGDGTAGKLITDPALYNHMNELSGKINDLMTHLNAGEGTAGQLLKDKQLYENMNGAVNDFRVLLSEIRKDPRRYLNVKVSIF